jgi:hypothetical protein
MYSICGAVALGLFSALMAFANIIIGRRDHE